MHLPHCRSAGAALILAVTALSAFPGVASTPCVDYGQYAHLAGVASLPVDQMGVVADAHHAYMVGATGGVAAVDLSDPTHPLPLEGVNLETGLENPVLRGSVLFAGSRDVLPGVHAVDVSTPASPQFAGSLAVPGGVAFVALHGDLLLVTRTTGTVDVVDAADPAAMTVITSLTMDAASLLSDGGNLVYASTTTHFQVWDFSDPAAPALRGSFTRSSHPMSTMALADPAHIVAPGTGYYDVHIIDVSDPDAPYVSGSFAPRYTPIHVTMAGNLAYITLTSGAVDIFDLGNLAAPVFLGSLPGERHHAPALCGQYLVRAEDKILRVYETAGAHLTYPTVGGYNWGWGFSYDAERLGDYVYLSSDLGLQVFDVSDPTAPVKLSDNTLPASVALSGDRLYAGHGNGLTVYGLANPAAPAVVATVPMAWWPAGIEIEAVGNLLVAAIRDSVVTFDLSNPDHPQQIGGRAMQVNTLELVDGLCFALSDTALHLLDLSDSANLPQLGHVAMSAEDLAVGGGYAYLSNWALSNGTLWVVDVCDPANPAIVLARSNHFNGGLSLHGTRLLCTQGGWGVQLLDVSNPLDPVRAGHLYHGYEVGWAYRARVVGDLVWVGSDEGVAFLPAPCSDATTAVPEQGAPARRGLALTGYPNPFNPRVDLRFTVSQRAPADVAVFDAAGRLVKTLLSGRQIDAGTHVLTWHGDGDDGRSLPSGTYLARVRVGDLIGTRKLALVR
jgi:hypothetical protein